MFPVVEAWGVISNFRSKAVAVWARHWASSSSGYWLAMELANLAMMATFSSRLSLDFHVHMMSDDS